MPRFFFHVDAPTQHEGRDQDGTVLDTLDEARDAGASLLAALINDDPAGFWASPDFTVTVTDANGLVLWTVNASGTASAATQVIRR